MTSTSRERERASPPQDEVGDERLSTLIMQWVARERRYRAIVTDKLKLVWANAPFLEQLQSGRLISLKDSHLVASQDIGSVLETCDAHAEHLWIGTSEDGLLVQILKLDDEGRHYALELVDQSPLPESLGPIIQGAFGLTKAEIRVLVQMLLGKSADEISRSLDVSVETVRSHIKRIYDKLGVSSRERLFSRLLPFAALGRTA